MQERESVARPAGAPGRLRRRSEFLRVAGGRKAHVPLFTLQMRPSGDAADGDGAAARVGITVTKKAGNAVERNRIRRRLRETLRLHADLGLQPRHDYVIVARRDLLAAPFRRIAASLGQAVGKVHKAGTDGNRARS